MYNRYINTYLNPCVCKAVVQSYDIAGGLVGRPKKPKRVKVKPETATQINRRIRKQGLDIPDGEPPRLKYHNNPNYHWIPKANQPERPNHALRMDNLKDYPEPPTQQAIDEYNAWKQTRKANHKTASPPTISRDPKHYSYRYGNISPRYYYLSHKAKDGLYKLARQHYYGRKDVYLSDLRQADVSKFIRALSNPDIVWQSNKDPVRQNILAWLGPDEIEYARQCHRILMTEQAEDTLYKLALGHGIYNWVRPQNLAKSPTISMLLEVIGQGYLIPLNVPINPEPALSYPRRHNNYVL